MGTRSLRPSVRRGGANGRSHGTVALDGDRSSALLLRVWLEGDGARAFRGRLTTVNTSPGARAGEEATVAVVSSPQEAVDAVRAWLDEFLRGVPGSVDADG